MCPGSPRCLFTGTPGISNRPGRRAVSLFVFSNWRSQNLGANFPATPRGRKEVRCQCARTVCFSSPRAQHRQHREDFRTRTRTRLPYTPPLASPNRNSDPRAHAPRDPHARERSRHRATHSMPSYPRHRASHFRSHMNIIPTRLHGLCDAFSSVSRLSSPHSPDFAFPPSRRTNYLKNA